MRTDTLIKHFERMGADLQIRSIPTLKSRGVRNISNETSSVRVNVARGKFVIDASPSVELKIIDVKPKDRHLVIEAFSDDFKSKFLCGHDERDWFVAALPESAPITGVESAKVALRPDRVKNEITRKRVKNPNKRKNEAFIRQGEWFFVPAPDLNVRARDIHKNEPIRRGAGKPHMVEEVFRRGGTQVYVNSKHPNGLLTVEYNALPEGKRVGFRIMQRDAQVYARGTVRHSDHKTIRLSGWHEVLMNTESNSRSMRHVAFLD